MNEPTTDQAVRLVRQVADLSRRMHDLEQLTRDLAVTVGIVGGMLTHHSATVAEVLADHDGDHEPRRSRS